MTVYWICSVKPAAVYAFKIGADLNHLGYTHPGSKPNNLSAQSVRPKETEVVLFFAYSRRLKDRPDELFKGLGFVRLLR